MVKNLKAGLLVFVFTLVLPCNLQADETGVVRVVDGDTIEVDGTVYRINGIDAPEYGQTCGAVDATWQCGKKALALMVDLVEGREVRCEAVEPDAYGRVVGTCYAGDLDIGSKIVKQGLACAFVLYPTFSSNVESEVRQAGHHIWSGPAQPAWEYSAARWEVEGQKAPDGCSIKGNISGNWIIYHPHWSPWHSRTKIYASRWERWFCTEAEAIAAGWRLPKWR